ncbi:MAG: flagellar hook-length control protein FliK [Pusillimonas sp.]|nr:flagellar hook-length control protein FliK [Pusillimonas sp.]
MSRFPSNHAQSKENKPSLSAIDWLGQNRQSADVLATARRMIEMEHVISQALPDNLARASRVAHIGSAEITLAVPSAAHAAKFRQLAPRIVQRLCQHGWNINQLKVKVQAGLNRNVTNMSRKKEVNPLDEQALTSFEELYRNTPPGPLAESLKRLIQRHRSSLMQHDIKQQ